MPIQRRSQVQSTGKTSQIENNTFREIDGRYIKVTVNGNSENDWASITEMRVDGLINSPSTATGQLFLLLLALLALSNDIVYKQYKY